jgi:hypothetical protein
MADQRIISNQYCHVTVVGQRRRVDLAVPAKAAIAEYVMQVAGLCGELDDGDADDGAPLPPAWSLALTESGPLPPGSSLEAAGVLDGQVLYLRDVAGAAAGPIVTDINEAIAAAADGSRWAWTSRARVATRLGAAAAWLTGTLLAFALLAGHLPGNSVRLVSALGIAAGITTALTAAAARKRSWPVPAWLPAVLALSVIAQFAVAGAMLVAAPLTGPEIALNAAVGALCGALLAVAVCPRATMTALAGAATLCLIVLVGLVVAHANDTECAAVVAVVGLWLYELAPLIAPWLVTRAGPGRSPDRADVAGQLSQTWLLVTVWQSMLAVIEAVALSWLAGSAQVFAYSLAGCVSLALLVLAGGARHLAAVLTGTAAGAVGLLGVLLLVPGRLGAPWWTAPAICAAVGLALLASGVGLVSRARATRIESGSWRGPLETLLRMASIPLAAGVFGAFGHLLTIGQHL